MSENTHYGNLLPPPPPQTLPGNSSEGLQPTHSQSSSSAGAHGLGGGTLTRPLSPEEIKPGNAQGNSQTFNEQNKNKCFCFAS